MELIYVRDTNKGAIFNYNNMKKKWYYMKKYNNEGINTKIYSGGIFAILNENIKPKISNKIPNNNSVYKSNDLVEILFNATDEHSGIDYNSIIVKIDNQTYFYDFIPYRDLVRCSLNKKLSPGIHTIEIYMEDRLHNSVYEKDTFYIEK